MLRTPEDLPPPAHFTAHLVEKMEKIEGKGGGKQREVRDEGAVRRRKRRGWGGELMQKEGTTLREKGGREEAN